MTDLEKIKAANTARNTEIMRAFHDGVDSDERQEGVTYAMRGVAAALLVVAAQFRARGEELKRLKRKGHVGTKDKLDFAAEQVEDLAISLQRGDEVDWTYAASEVAGVAVSLERDGVRVDDVHVCDYVEPDGTTMGVCHLPGRHGGRSGEWVEPGRSQVDGVCGKHWRLLGLGAEKRCTRTPGHSGECVQCLDSAEPCDIAVDHRHDDATGGISMNSGGAPIVVDENALRIEYGQSDAPAPARTEGERCPIDGPALGVTGEGGPTTFASCHLVTGHEGPHSDGHGQWPDDETEPGRDGVEVATAETFPEPLYDGMCASESLSERCMLPVRHTGIHIGRKGGRWPQTAAEQVSEVKADVTAIMGELRGDAPITIAEPRGLSTPHLLSTVTVLDMGDDGGLRRVESTGPVAVLAPPVTPDFNQVDITLEVPVTGAAPLNLTMAGLISLTGVPMSGFTPAPAGMAAGMVIAPAGPRLLDLDGPVPGVPKPYHSASSIDTMAECGLKYRFQYRDRLPQRPAWWNAGGTAFHSYAQWVEELLFGMPHAQAVPVLDSLAGSASSRFLSLFKAEVDKLAGESGTSPEGWRVASKGKETRQWWEDEGGTMSAQYLLNRAQWGSRHQLVALPDGKPAVEVGFTVDVGGVVLKGYIDQVWRDRQSGGLVVRDLKAGSRKPASSFQLGVYSAALPSVLPGLGAPETPTAGSYYMARKAEDVPVNLGGPATSRKTVEYRARQTAMADAAGIFIPRPSEFCVACPFYAMCPAVS